MKLTTKQLKQIIKEELSLLCESDFYDWLGSQGFKDNKFSKLIENYEWIELMIELQAQGFERVKAGYWERPSDELDDTHYAIVIQTPWKPKVVTIVSSGSKYEFMGGTYNQHFTIENAPEGIRHTFKDI